MVMGMRPMFVYPLSPNFFLHISPMYPKDMYNVSRISMHIPLLCVTAKVSCQHVPPCSEGPLWTCFRKQ